MNSKTLISQAGFAIDIFKIDYNSACCLCIKDGFVVAVPASNSSHRTPSCLFLTHIEQKKGLSNLQWNRIGQTLLTQYDKEKSCQQPPKPNDGAHNHDAG